MNNKRNRISLINEAFQNTLFEIGLLPEQRSARPLPPEMVAKRERAEKFRRERAEQNWEYTLRQRERELAARDERREALLNRNQDEWFDKMNRMGRGRPEPDYGPEETPQEKPQVVTPPSARDDWYNEPKQPERPPPKQAQKPAYNPDTAPPIPGSNIPPASPPPPNYVEDPTKGPVGLGGTEGDPAFDAYRDYFKTGEQPKDQSKGPVTPPETEGDPAFDAYRQQFYTASQKTSSPESVASSSKGSDRYYTATKTNSRPQSVIAVANQLSKMRGATPLTSRPIQDRMA